MKRVLSATLVLCITLGFGGAGYWLGQQNAGPTSQESSTTESQKTPTERTVLYYRDPSGKPDYSPVSKKDSMGMDYLPVYDEEGVVASAPQPLSAPKGKGKILYYRHSMGLPDKSPVPKKDAMGMDYIPVYEGDAADDTGTVNISLAKVQKLGVRTELVELRDLSRIVRAVGTIRPDERRLYVVNTKFEGWIERLLVNATGQAVQRGQPLMEVYAPELVVVQQEYLLAWRWLQAMSSASGPARTSAKQLADAALQRLRNWDISADQVTRLQNADTVSRTLTLRAPADGIVMEKMAVEGMRFMAGEPLYRIADLSTVWLIADVFEQDLGSLRQDQNAKITVNAYPNDTFTGKVDFIYPTVSKDTRTGRVRVVIPNPDGRLKTDMYANVEFAAAIGAGQVLTVPDSAIIDDGTRQLVLVERGEGTYEPRGVKLGAKGEGYYAVRDGLTVGERVVVAANFLIDAESNLRAALKSFSAGETSSSSQATVPPENKGGKRE